MKRTALALAAIALTSGCAGTRLAKLAKCTGPYRYANANGTILPALPVPGQQPAAATPAPVPVAPEPQESDGRTTHRSKRGAKPAKTSALQSHYPSC